MTTPIIMLVLMIGPYAIARSFSVVTGRQFDLRSAAAIGLAFMTSRRVFKSKTDA
jgi:hypothetical protein